MYGSFFNVFLFVAVNVFAGTLAIKNPPQNGYLIEGKSYTIRWEGDLKGKVCITVLAGGKDRGIINNCETDADEGRFVWTIPSDFVTGFGIWENNRVRVGIFEKGYPDKIFYSGYFTVAGFEKINSKTPEDAVKNFYRFLSEKRYKAAFSMLNKVDMRFTDCYGEEMHIAGFYRLLPVDG
ncbi:MAG: hypothetical protein Q9M89_08605 [Persephonella sp.]|nr:hypothetical protein [Persephonella sp.]